MAQTKRICGIYEVYNKNNELLARGFKEDVAIVLGCNPSYVSCYALHDRLYKGKFRIVLIDKVDKNVEYCFKDRVAEKPIPDYILVQIKKEGNVALPDGDPNYYLEYLRENGFNCSVREAEIISGKNNRKESYYVAEVMI